MFGDSKSQMLWLGWFSRHYLNSAALPLAEKEVTIQYSEKAVFLHRPPGAEERRKYTRKSPKEILISAFPSPEQLVLVLSALGGKLVYLRGVVRPGVVTYTVNHDQWDYSIRIEIKHPTKNGPKELQPYLHSQADLA